MTTMDEMRVFNIRPPVLDPEANFPSTDCQHDDLRELFFAPDGERGEARTRREHAARRVCGECPFVVGCGQHALEHEDYGLWGAMSGQDRRALGGRGVPEAAGQPPRPKTVVHRMAKAGVKPSQIEALVRHARRVAATEREAA